jgi:hypothetical protein
MPPTLAIDAMLTLVTRGASFFWKCKGLSNVSE